jgi:uncharacterized membrane protein
VSGPYFKVSIARLVINAFKTYLKAIEAFIIKEVCGYDYSVNI